MTSLLPFYSSRVREALSEAISNDGPTPGPSAVAAAAMPEAGAVIRGRRVSSSDDDDNDVRSEGDDSTSSSDSSDSEEEAAEKEGEGAAAVAATAKSDDRPRAGGGGKSKGKKSGGKQRTREDRVQKMGRPPCVLLPLRAATSSAPPTAALEVPVALLPHDCHRDDPPSDLARSLLSSWDRSHGASPDGDEAPTALVVLLQSGRFAASAFALRADAAPRAIAHRTSTRYTVRKGQGGAQSSNDQSKGKAKSMGAQLRREGERRLREDVRATWREWRREGIVDRAVGVYVACPKAMRREYLFGGDDGRGLADDALVSKGDERLRSVPLDSGRPTMEAAAAVLECLLGCCIREMTKAERAKYCGVKRDDASGDDSDRIVKEIVVPEKKQEVEPEVKAPPEAPLTLLHEAVIDGDLDRLLELLTILEEAEEPGGTTYSVDYDVNTPGGPGGGTPLHAAAASDLPDAASFISALLVRGRCDPCAVDARGRPAYYVAASDKHREAFRLARGTLGEGHCSWDEGARVGPALTDEDLRSKKAKAAEKKRRQRARQKERKAAEKQAAEEEAAAMKREEEKKKEEEDARRVRAGLKPKTSATSNACDFCQKVVRGKRRSQMFQRLEYAYCTTECVRRHQRELTAAAATARLGG